MNTVCTENMCAGCMACLEVCPKDAIEVKNEIQYYNAVINELSCIGCNACHNVCQYNHSPLFKAPSTWYQGWSSNDKIRADSSSGGLGTALLRLFIEKYGNVCACIYKNGCFQFEFADSIEDISKFSGSKYVKSNPFGIYKKVKTLLKNNKNVLFIGLPCQVAALKNFVGDKFSENLYTVDMICHGSPSPLLLELFFKDYDIDLKMIQNIEFRKKNKFHLYIDKEFIIPERVRDMYTAAFLNGLNYTENCYKCKYAQFERVSDITIGDSWGSELNLQEQKKGISLICCQTPKGEKLIQEAGLHLEFVDIEKAKTANHQLNYPSPMPDCRVKFFQEIQKGSGFNKAVSKCIPKEYYKEKIKMTLIRMKILLDK